MHRQDDTPLETGMEVAIIGMAGQFPGAGSLAHFWENLKNGIESISFFSDDELKRGGIDIREHNPPHFVRAHGSLAGSDEFDAYFFTYTPREAVVMDPQVRLFHQCAWEALENAAYDPGTYHGSIGVYAGADSNFGWQALVRLNDANKAVDPFTANQLLDKDFMGLHISYKLNLKGPAVTVASACSTSLLAVALACQGLLAGECDLALAGGVSIQSPPQYGYPYEEGKIPSPDGHCRAFDQKAAGTNSGGGVAVVVLKLLETARQEGDHIYAVIKGFGMNNDGVRKAGFTAPSVDGQAEVIRAALRMSAIPPERITCLEAHGTGTSLGDPVEIEALNLAFASKKKAYCAIGSVKSNLGHLGSAAGVTGLIKAILSLHHRQIPPSLHFESPNPAIDFNHSPFYVNTGLKEWQSDHYPRCAGVSSFGIGGTNVHVILEEWPLSHPLPGEQPALPASTSSSVPPTAIGKTGTRDYHLLLLSAKTPTALETLGQNLAAFIRENFSNTGNADAPLHPPQPGLTLANVAYTLQTGRKAFKHRNALVCASTVEALEALTSPGSPRVQTGSSGRQIPRLVFMFSGQGSQYIDMGRQLYQDEPVFRQSLDRCFEILKPLLPKDLKAILYPPRQAPPERSIQSNPSDKSCRSNIPGQSAGSDTFDSSADTSTLIRQTEVAQPLLFAFETSLARLLISWGLTPYAMIGHSIGEYTAAHLAGVFILEEALELVALRGRLMQQMPPGAMLGIPLPEEQVTPLLTAGLSLAAVNNPDQCTVSGPGPALADFERLLAEKGVQCRPLHTSHAFHSAMMDPLLESFSIAAARFHGREPKIPFVSNLTGQWFTAHQARDPRYWSRHLRQTVRFSQGISLLLQEENTLFLEIGPGMVLSSLVAKHPAKSPGQLALNLVRHPKENTADRQFLLGKIAQLWLQGVTVNWTAFQASGPGTRQRLALPTYPFEKQLFRLDKANLKFQAPLAKRDRIADWFYQPSWKRVELPASGSSDPAAPLPSRCCLVFTAANSPTATWSSLLRQQGLEVIEVKEDSGFSRQDRFSYTLAPHEPHHYERLFQQLREEKRIPHSIFHLWNLTANTGEELLAEPDIETVRQFLDRGYYSLLHLARAIGKTFPAEPVQLLVLSDQMQEVTGEPLSAPWKSPLLGPVKTIPREYPRIQCRSIDILLPAPGTPQEQILVRQLLAELASPAVKERVIALRRQVRWVESIEPISLPGENEPAAAKDPDFPRTVRQRGVYLITGGLGGIGLTLAGWLASRFNARLALTGRSALPPRTEWLSHLENPDTPEVLRRKLQSLQALETAGAEVLYLQADISQPPRMEAAVHRAEQHFGPINGIIHCAGIADAGMIQRRTGEMSEEVFAAKILGALNLHAIFNEKPLDFLVLCSSLAAYTAPFGQVAYSSANGFLDAFAAYWRQQCKPQNPPGCPDPDTLDSPVPDVWSPPLILSINWDTWQQVGMAVAAVKKMAESSRVDIDIRSGILPHEGQEVFHRLLSAHFPAFSSLSRLLVSTRDLPALVRQQEEVTASTTPDPLDQSPESSGTRQILFQRPQLSTEYVAPATNGEKMLAELLQHVLGIDRVGIFDNFFELGVSSLDVINLSNRLKNTLHLDISTVIIFENPTLRALARFLEKEQNRAGAAQTTKPAPEKSLPEKLDRSRAIDTGKDRLQRILKTSKEN